MENKTLSYKPAPKKEKTAIKVTIANGDGKRGFSLGQGE